MALTPLNPSFASALTGVAPVSSFVAATQNVATHVTPPGDAQSAGLAPDDDELHQAVRNLNSRLTAWSTNLRFEIDDETSRVVVQVVDIESGDVVRQIPSEEVLHMSKMLGKLHDLSFRASA